MTPERPPGRHRRPPRSLRSFGVAIAVVVVAAMAGLFVRAAVAPSTSPVHGVGAPPSASGAIPSAPPESSAPTSPAPTTAPVATEELVIHGAGDVNLDPSFLPTF